MNGDDSTVSVLLGNGDGTFRLQVNHSAGSQPLGMAIGDFNGDGLADLVAVNHTAVGTASVLLSARTETATEPAFVCMDWDRYNVLAEYPGDATHAASQSTSAPLVGLAQATTTRLAASSNSAIAGQLLALTATVRPVPTATPTGTVSFYAGAMLLGGVSVNASGIATFTTSSLAPGSYSITAQYSGNASFAASISSSLIETINRLPIIATKTKLTTSVNPAVLGGRVAFTATVTPAPTGAPAGTVSFYAGTFLLRTGTVNEAGVATFTTAGLADGYYRITASYSGNRGFDSSTSSVLGLTIRTYPSGRLRLPTPLSVIPARIRQSEHQRATSRWSVQ